MKKIPIIFLIPIVFSFIGIVVFFQINSYLPAPFFYNKYDVFMDFFHVHHWVYDSGRYSEWQSIYSPFSFLVTYGISILSLFNVDVYSHSSVWVVRDVLFVKALFVFILCIGFIVLVDFLRLKGSEKKYLFVIYFGTPFLFAFERGNLIIFAYFFLLLAFVTRRNDLLFSLFLAAAISLKFYLIALLFIPFLMRRYFVILLTVTFFYCINEVSALILGADDWWLFLPNMAVFSGDEKYFEWGYFTYSYRNLLLGFGELRPNFSLIVQSLDSLTLGVCFFLFTLTTLRFLKLSRLEKRHNSGYIYLLLLMLIMIVVKNAGGYVFILLFPFIRYMTRSKLQVFMLVLLILPMPVSFDLLNLELEVYSFFSGDEVEIIRDINLDMLVRPIGFLLLYLSVTIHFLRVQSRRHNINV